MKKHKTTTGVSAAGALDSSPSHLLHRVLQIALDIYNAETGDGALTQRQYAVLKALEGDTEAEGKSQTDLVTLTGIDRSTLADMVTRMTQRGLLVREKSASDARANLIRLSHAGRESLYDIEPRVKLADAKILALLSGPKRLSFVKLLRKIAQSRHVEVRQADAEAEIETLPGKKAKHPKVTEHLAPKKTKKKKIIKAEKPVKAAKVKKNRTKATESDVAKPEASPPDMAPADTSAVVRLHDLMPVKEG